MSKLKIIVSVLLFAVLSIIIMVFIRKKDSVTGISIIYPFNNALSPPEFPAPALNTYESFAYSQLFFPVNGHLAIYDRQSRILKELPGANLDEYVQSNAVWTPDGKNIIFSRAGALQRDSDLYKLTVQNSLLVD